MRLVVGKPAFGKQQEHGAVAFMLCQHAGSLETAHDDIATVANLPFPPRRGSRDDGDVQHPGEISSHPGNMRLMRTGS